MYVYIYIYIYIYDLKPLQRSQAPSCMLTYTYTYTQWSHRHSEKFIPQHGLFHVAELGISAAQDEDVLNKKVKVCMPCRTYVYIYIFMHVCIHVLGFPPRQIKLCVFCASTYIHTYINTYAQQDPE